MNDHLANLPLWAVLPGALFLVIGATLSLIGTFGLATMKGFYDRLHAPTLVTSWGTAGIIVASILLFSAIEGRFIIHAIVIGCFVMITTPVTLLVLGRAALQRDRAEGADVPMPTPLDPEPGPVESEIVDETLTPEDPPNPDQPPNPAAPVSD